MLTAIVEQKTGNTYKDYSMLPEGAPYQLIGGVESAELSIQWILNN